MVLLAEGVLPLDTVIPLNPYIYHPFWTPLFYTSQVTSPMPAPAIDVNILGPEFFPT